MEFLVLATDSKKPNTTDVGELLHLLKILALLWPMSGLFELVSWSIQSEQEDTKPHILLNVKSRHWCNSTVEKAARKMSQVSLTLKGKAFHQSVAWVSNSCLAVDAKRNTAQISLVGKTSQADTWIFTITPDTFTKSTVCHCLFEIYSSKYFVTRLDKLLIIQIEEKYENDKVNIVKFLYGHSVQRETIGFHSAVSQVLVVLPGVSVCTA